MRNLVTAILNLPAIVLLWVTLLPAKAQVIPDLIRGDYYKPYLTEDQKREQIQTTQKKHPSTPEEMNTSAHPDYLAPIRGTTADPANVFKNYAQVGFVNPSGNTHSGMPQRFYSPNLTIAQRNQALIDASMAEYAAQKKRSEALLNEAVRDFAAPDIHYNLGLHNGDRIAPFVKAFATLGAMLNGSQKIDLLKATWLVESSLDVSLSWEEFSRMFHDDLQIISQLLAASKAPPNDNLAKLMSIYKFMTDTTSVRLAGKEKRVVTKPMLYDFEDYEGKKDLNKVFVSKLLRTGTGQCMSLPMLYLLFAKALGAEAYLAFAPQHSYITFRDKPGNWQNIELTGGIFASSDLYWQSGFIKAEQVKSGIYLTPVSEKQTIAHLLTTLALTYIKTFGTDDRVLEMSIMAREHAPNDITANMIMTGYTQELWKNVLRQYQVHGLDEDRLANDTRAQAVRQAREKLLEHLYKDLGWAKMPEEAYKKWLDAVNELAAQRQHMVKRRQLEQQLNR